MIRETEKRIVIFGTLFLSIVGGALAPSIINAINNVDRQIDASSQQDVSGLVTAICYYPDSDTPPICTPPTP